MSAPTFSSNPDDYPDVATAVSNLGVTPVLVVVGGSYAINTTSAYSDLDIWACHLEDEPDEISIDAEVRLVVLGDKDWTQFISFSLNNVRREPVNDPPRRIWMRENFLAFPRIFDSTYAEEFRKELLEVPMSTVAQYYLEAGDWYVDNLLEIDKFRVHAVRMYLTGARLLEVEDLIVDYQALIDWAGVSTVAEARQRLEQEISKLE